MNARIIIYRLVCTLLMCSSCDQRSALRQDGNERNAAAHSQPPTTRNAGEDDVQVQLARAGPTTSTQIDTSSVLNFEIFTANWFIMWNSDGNAAITYGSNDLWQVQSPLDFAETLKQLAVGFEERQEGSGQISGRVTRRAGTGYTLTPFYTRDEALVRKLITDMIEGVLRNGGGDNRLKDTWAKYPPILRRP